MDRINKIAEEFSKKLPEDLIDKDSYISALKKNGIAWLLAYKTKANSLFNQLQANLVLDTKELIKIPKSSLKTPKTVIQFINDNPKIKGFPNMQNYGREMSKIMKDLGYKSADTETGATLWQKVELDLRHNAQLEKISQAMTSGNDLWWLSAHVDASERCAPWQGKLVSMSMPPINKAMYTGKKAGRTPIYSFTGITEQVDKYGYKNNIIVGFNCRHRLIPYNGETTIRPDPYSAKDMKLERKLNSKMREFERKIRNLKAEARVKYAAGFKKEAVELSRQATNLKKAYIQFAQKNDLVWYDYRIK